MRCPCLTARAAISAVSMRSQLQGWWDVKITIRSDWQRIVYCNRPFPDVVYFGCTSRSGALTVGSRIVRLAGMGVPLSDAVVCYLANTDLLMADHAGHFGVARKNNSQALAALTSGSGRQHGMFHLGQTRIDG